MIVELDTLLPRIVQLATQRGDRQTKALAAESLHAIVLYMVSMTLRLTQTTCILPLHMLLVTVSCV
jgi:hypothetical protein